MLLFWIYLTLQSPGTKVRATERMNLQPHSSVLAVPASDLHAGKTENRLSFYDWGQEPLCLYCHI